MQTCLQGRPLRETLNLSKYTYTNNFNLSNSREHCVSKQEIQIFTWIAQVHPNKWSDTSGNVATTHEHTWQLMPMFLGWYYFFPSTHWAWRSFASSSRSSAISSSAAEVFSSSEPRAIWTYCIRSSGDKWWQGFDTMICEKSAEHIHISGYNLSVWNRRSPAWQCRLVPDGNKPNLCGQASKSGGFLKRFLKRRLEGLVSSWSAIGSRYEMAIAMLSKLAVLLYVRHFYFWCMAKPCKTIAMANSSGWQAPPGTSWLQRAVAASDNLTLPRQEKMPPRCWWHKFEATNLICFDSKFVAISWP